jgi:hypothetical protein
MIKWFKRRRELKDFVKLNKSFICRLATASEEVKKIMIKNYKEMKDERR